MERLFDRSFFLESSLVISQTITFCEIFTEIR
nr:MAG TPA: hypothetical protein [Caudoviricetes sp.]